jgi:TetR/AcrR family transcriptional regulator, lmrAB and yxaGH operons repressor
VCRNQQFFRVSSQWIKIHAPAEAREREKTTAKVDLDRSVDCFVFEVFGVELVSYLILPKKMNLFSVPSVRYIATVTFVRYNVNGYILLFLSMSKQTHVLTLLKLFRQFGYEGVTISKISQATGLGKASIYHHFPGGKAEMAESALNYVNQWLEMNILEILDSQNPPLDKFQAMCAETNRFFNEGQDSCLWAGLVLEQSSNDLFHTQISWAFSQWIESIANVLVTAGLDKSLAKQRGEDAMIAIQGGLILCHGLQDFTPFERVLKQLPQRLCEGI